MRKNFRLRLSVLMVLLSILNSSGSSSAAPPAAPDPLHTDHAQIPAVTSAGVSYYLDSMNVPDITAPNDFIGSRGVWCEIGTIASSDACALYHLLSFSFDGPARYGDSGYALKLTYNVEQSDTLASYYEGLYNGDTFYDLSSFDEFHFRVKGEGATIGSGTKFYIRFADKDWNMAYVTVDGAGSDWEEKVKDLHALSSLDWRHMREMTIIFENNRAGGAGRQVVPLSGTLYILDFGQREFDSDITEVSHAP